jgi:hypothetical protein
MWRLLRRIGRLNPLLLGPFKINLGSLGSNGFQVAIRRFERIGIGVASCTTICVIAIPGHESRIRWLIEFVEQSLWLGSKSRLGKVRVGNPDTTAMHNPVGRAVNLYEEQQSFGDRSPRRLIYVELRHREPAQRRIRPSDDSRDCPGRGDDSGSEGGMAEKRASTNQDQLE